MNKLGANTWIWVSPLTDERLTQLAPRVRDMGFDVVELPIEQLGDWSPEHAAEVLAEHGLGASIAVAMAPGRELCGADAETVATTQAFLRECLDVAADSWGAARSPARSTPRPAGPGGSRRMSAVRSTRSCARTSRPVAEHAGEVGVKIGIEPLVRYETSLINTVEQALEAIDPLPDSVGLLLDTYHANVEEKDFAGSFRLGGPRLVHVHASANDRGAPGADHIDWAGFRDAIRDTGYAGPIVIESFTAENETIATAASVWRPLAASQDAIAVDGLAFLRNLFAY